MNHLIWIYTVQTIENPIRLIKGQMKVKYRRNIEKKSLYLAPGQM